MIRLSMSSKYFQGLTSQALQDLTRAVEKRRCPCPAITAPKQPVLAAQGKGTDGVLGRLAAGAIVGLEPSALSGRPH